MVRSAFALLCSFLCIGAVSPSLASQSSSEEPADWLIWNAKVMTPGSDGEDAIAIGKGKVLAVGPLDRVKKWEGARTKRIDAKGGSVTPGLNDAHVHFLSGSRSLGEVNLLDAQTFPEIESKIRSYANAHPKLPCVVGRGWLYGAFENGLPTRAQLDALIPKRPAIMKCYDGHTVWVNSEALKQAGIDRNTKDPPNGVIVRDEKTGDPTGVLKESAMDLIDKIMPKLTREENLDALRLGQKEAHRFGVTSVQEAGMGEQDIELFEQLRKNKELTLRVYFALEARPKMTDAEIEQLLVIRKRFRDLRIGAVKMYADGVIEAHTASVLEPYVNKNSRGMPEYNVADMNRIIRKLDAMGWQIMTHAIGDAGIRMVLDAYEAAAIENPPPSAGRRHRVEHIESISQNDIRRFGALGVVASMQPFHASPNGNIFQVWAVNLGPERASRAWVWKSIRDQGGRLAFGSDWPVVGIDPRPGIHTALTRQTPQGAPAGGFHPEQKLPLRVVLESYTLGSAYAEFAEKEKGTLEPGKLADLVIWNQDLFSVPVDRVQFAEVELTMVGGEIVYSRKE